VSTAAPILLADPSIPRMVVGELDGEATGGRLDRRGLAEHTPVPRTLLVIADWSMIDNEC